MAINVAGYLLWGLAGIVLTSITVFLSLAFYDEHRRKKMRGKEQYNGYKPTRRRQEDV